MRNQNEPAGVDLNEEIEVDGRPEEAFREKMKGEGERVRDRLRLEVVEEAGFFRPAGIPPDLDHPGPDRDPEGQPPEQPQDGDRRTGPVSVSISLLSALLLRPPPPPPPPPGRCQKGAEDSRFEDLALPPIGVKGGATGGRDDREVQDPQQEPDDRAVAAAATATATAELPDPAQEGQGRPGSPQQDVRGVVVRVAAEPPEEGGVV